MTCPVEIKQMWDMVKDSLRDGMSTAAFDMWYGDLVPSEYDHDTNTLTFDCKSEFLCSRLRETHTPILRKAFMEEAGMDIYVEFRYIGKPSPLHELLERIGADMPKKEPERSPDDVLLLPENGQYTQYTFDNFIVGASNRFARAVCWQVANNPFNEYNPLFIHGPSGVGKTHLMYAVINEMRRAIPQIRVNYTKGEDFTNDMVDHLSKGTMAQFRETYRSCDVLLIDDIQFIANKKGTQEEVFHTFQALFDEGKQIILASDRPPKDIHPLEERLRSRFEQGLLADINPPDFELRMAIIKKKADDLHVDVPTEVLTFLAENLRSNIRQIEGSIKKLSAKSMIEGRKISLAMAKESLSDLVGDAEPLEVTIDKIFAAVTKKYEITREEIVGTKRSKEIVNARHVATYLIREVTELSFARIGKIFGGKDHTSVLYSCNWVQDHMLKNPLFHSDIEMLRKEITGN